MNEVDLSYKFQPLFEILEGKYPQVDTVIMTGGRYSLKSHTVAILSLTALVNYGWNTLYTRFTNMSISDSIKPEVSGKIDMLGYTNIVKDTETQIEYNGARISFKGIKTGSKQQTANLKSLSGFNMFVNDEAEELPDYETFKKIYYSIRSTDKQNVSILILNPTDESHWIHEQYFEKKGVENGSNCVKDNVMYIHTSYLDADFKKMPENILAEYERLKNDDPIEYENIVLGGWKREREGVLIPMGCLKFADVSLIDYKSFNYMFSVADPADHGGDKYACPFMGVRIEPIERNGHKYTDVYVYVLGVLCNNDGIVANTQNILHYRKQYTAEHIFIEKNGLGLASYIELAKYMNGEVLKPFTSNENKEHRILGEYEFIRTHFVFDSKWKDNPQYRQFMLDLTSYNRDGDNKHKKDAIDVLSTASNVVKIKYRSIIFG